MNKTELISLLREPNQLTESQLDELEEVIEEFPYFLSPRILMAKGSRQLKHKETKNRIASAAVYSTDRTLLKKYLSDKLFFLSEPPAPNTTEVEVAPKEKKIRKKAESTPEYDSSGTVVIPEIPSGHLDEILDELKQDMENLKSSRGHFVEVQLKIEEEDAVTAALERATRKKKLN